MSIVKIHHKGQMTIPRPVRSAAGLADGDLVEVKLSGRTIIITPTLVIDRSQFPSADDEYTPEQRRVIKAQIKEAEKGPFYGPFRSGAAVAAFLRKRARPQRGVKPGTAKKAT